MSRRGTSIRLATRGSELALRQARTVKGMLEDRRHEVELVEVETEGDRIRDELIHRLGRTGAFVRALDERVLDGTVDAAVHSMKDMPTEQPEGLVVAGVPERASPGDTLLTPDGRSLDGLAEGATVGTSSLRRTAQLLSRRPDLDVRGLRGNVDTRVEKLLAPTLQAEHERRMEAEAEAKEEEGSEDADEPAFEQSVDEWFDALSEVERRALGRQVETEYDAIVLARAGLERSDLARQVEFHAFPPAEFVPAPGQGALAVTTREDDLAETVHDALDHPRTRTETTVERVVLAELGGGCIAPVGVYAVVQGDRVHVEAEAFSTDGTERAAISRDVPVEKHAEGARELAVDLADRGARELVEAAREGS